MQLAIRFRFQGLRNLLRALKHIFVYSVSFAFKADSPVILSSLDSSDRVFLKKDDILYAFLDGTIEKEGKSLQIDLVSALLKKHLRCLFPGITGLLTRGKQPTSRMSSCMIISSGHRISDEQLRAMVTEKADKGPSGREKPTDKEMEAFDKDVEKAYFGTQRKG